MVESGIEIKYYDRNSKGLKLEVNNVVELDVKYYDSNNMLLFSSRELPNSYRIKLKGNDYGGSAIDTALQYLSVGDSASILIDAQNFYQMSRGEDLPESIKQGSKLRFEVRVITVVSKDVLDKEKAELYEKMKTQELDFLEHFVRDYYPDAEQSISGLYVSVYKKGTGKTVYPGDKVAIHYRGKFLSGEIFDSSIKRKKPFSFILGTAQVIAGLEEGINGKKVGDKIHLFIPSHLAYGEKGVENFIAPFSSLHFDLEILSAQSSK